MELRRGNSPELEAIRQVCLHNLNQAVWMTCDRMINELMETRRLIHPWMVLTRNWALQKTQAELL